jgi:hypothetical protein
MTWIAWSLLSALFAAATALLAKKGLTGIDPNLATAIRTTAVVFSPERPPSPSEFIMRSTKSVARAWFTWLVPDLRRGSPGSAIFAPFVGTRVKGRSRGRF